MLRSMFGGIVQTKPSFFVRIQSDRKLPRKQRLEAYNQNSATLKALGIPASREFKTKEDADKYISDLSAKTNVPLEVSEGMWL